MHVCLHRKPVVFVTLGVFALLFSGVARGQDAPLTTWPLRVDSPSGVLTMYQPQPDKFEGDTLTARAAVSLTPTGATDPEFGALWMQARVSTDRDAHTVTIQNMTVKRVNLPNASPDQEAQFSQILGQQIPPLNVVMSLDQLEATLGAVEKAKEESQQLDNTPPKIIFTTMPATLVIIDGQPKLQAAQAMGVMRVVNTPFIMLLDMQSKTYFLKAGDVWESAPDATGPWAVTNSIPAGINDEGLKLVSEATPPTTPDAQASTAQPAAATIPPTTPTQIIVSEEPAELISSDGQPAYSPLPGNSLLYMSNTQSDVFMDVPTQQSYVLLSGRWFAGKSLQGPWAFVASDQLPPAFAQIPPDSAKGNVLISVAGTQQAKDARLDASLPQTTAINKDAGANFSVNYDGAPQFAGVDNSSVTYASNSADPVLHVDNGYFCCSQAVWYQSASPTGPWTVATAVPPAIYTIPPSCPDYYCRYAYVYGSNGDSVYTGYLPGYTGSYVYGSTLVYGTGYNYPYWYGHQFIPRPFTWGFGSRYDFQAGMWGLGASVAYTPSWFSTSDRVAHWWGPQGYVDYHTLHGYRTAAPIVSRTRDVTQTRVNIYNREENVKRNVTIAHDNHSEAARAEPAHQGEVHAENNVYVGNDGHVYRRTTQGWETNDGKNWAAVKAEQEPSHGVKSAEHIDDQAKVQNGAIDQHEAAHENRTAEAPARQVQVQQQPDRQPTRVEEPMHALDMEQAARERGSQQQSAGGGERLNGGGGGGAVRSGGASTGGGSIRR